MRFLFATYYGVRSPAFPVAEETGPLPQGRSYRIPLLYKSLLGIDDSTLKYGWCNFPKNIGHDSPEQRQSPLLSLVLVSRIAKTCHHSCEEENDKKSSKDLMNMLIDMGDLSKLSDDEVDEIMDLL